MLACSGKPSRAESIYRSIVAQQGGDGVNFDFSAGTRQECTAYAQAMGAARASMAVVAAGNQQRSSKTSWMLGEKEREYGLIPAPRDDIPARQAALEARKAAPAGSAIGPLAGALSTLLGSVFLGLRLTKQGEITTWPTNLGDQPMNLRPSTDFPKIFQLVDAVSLVGAPSTVAYGTVVLPLNARFIGSGILYPGDVVVVGTDNPATAERVTVTATGFQGEIQRTFTATFAKAHDPGSFMRVGDYPLWVSNQRHILVILTAAGAVDAETRRKVHELMGRIVHATTTWAIVAGVNATTAGPFILDQSKLDVTSIGQFTFP